jgi:hypothetical protein
MDEHTQMAMPSTQLNTVLRFQAPLWQVPLARGFSTFKWHTHHDDLDSDRPTKVPRILAVQGVDHEDEEPVVLF